jgi:hypothetical protein
MNFLIFKKIFNCGELALKINDPHICKNRFHENEMDLYIEKT